MSLLELCMIVKNSGNVLKECLRENKKWIDYWTILDTGSTDNTKEIIMDELKDIPGKLYDGEFIDFSQARNKALSLISKKCKYIIMLDDSYILHGADKLKKLLKKEKTSCFLIKIGKYIDNFLRDDYYSKRITKSSDNLKYKYRVHEDIMVNENKIKFIMDKDIFIDDITFGEHTKRSLNRYKKDIENLLLDHEDEPNEQRIIYYIGKTYHVIEEYDNALKYFTKLKDLKNIREDFLFSAYYEIACIQYLKDDNIEDFRERLLYLYKYYNYRVESAYKLAILYRDEGNIDKALELLEKIINIQKPIMIGTLLENDIYDYYIPYMYADLNLSTGNLQKGVPLLQKLLTFYPNDQPLLNMKYNICDNLTTSSIELSNGKTIVIHTGHSELISCWNPNGDRRISGSEIMAINLAKEFDNIGYRVIIFGSFYDTKKNITYEGIYDNIEYIDYKYFSEFALKYIIDYLIVSRYTANLVYYDNIKNVYLWIHDVLPLIGDNSKFIQYHKTKFKSIIAISEWQKENTVKKLNIPPERIIVSRNAIHINKFLNRNIEKVPFRFIYSSCAQRGLDYLIKIIPKIKEKYPQTTLHLFILSERATPETLKIIENLDYVYLNDRVSQDQLVIEFLKSDIWLYPTNFPETYCITALEAMASKCLVATVNYCGLANTVKGKSVLCEAPIQDNLDDLINKLFFILSKPALKEYIINKAYNWSLKQSYHSLAWEWVNNIF